MKRKKRFVVHFQCQSGELINILAVIKPIYQPAQSDLHGSTGFGYAVVVDMTETKAKSLRPKLERAGARAVAINQSL